jgi:hypothetical protein
MNKYDEYDRELNRILTSLKKIKTDFEASINEIERDRIVSSKTQ